MTREMKRFAAEFGIQVCGEGEHGEGYRTMMKRDYMRNLWYAEGNYNGEDILDVEVVNRYLCRRCLEEWTRCGCKY